jgi:hypothetical protein
MYEENRNMNSMVNQDKELENCTFAPQTNRYKKNKKRQKKHRETLSKVVNVDLSE